MKLKLFLVSILALLSLVGYQKYSEYQALRSINTYDECAAAKGSVIQESYPSTCITRLNSRFTQPIATTQSETVISMDTSKWKTYSGVEYSFKYPEEGEVKTNNGLVVLTYNQMIGGEMMMTFDMHHMQNQSLKGYLTAMYLPNADGNQTIVDPEPAHFGGFDGYKASIWAVDAGGYSYFIFESEDKKHIMVIEHDSFVDVGWLNGPSSEQVAEANNQREIFDKILSTFKFLDAEPTL